MSVSSYATAPLSPRALGRGPCKEEYPRGAYKVRGGSLSYVNGFAGSSSVLLENATGAPPPIKALGAFGTWIDSRFGYELRIYNTLSRNALMSLGYVPPPPQEVADIVDAYWENLETNHPTEYEKIREQLQALAEERGYTAPTPLKEAETYSYLSPRSPRGKDLSPKQVLEEQEEGVLPARPSYYEQYRSKYEPEYARPVRRFGARSAPAAGAYSPRFLRSQRAI